jgi:hypothetical protein
LHNKIQAKREREKRVKTLNLYYPCDRTHVPYVNSFTPLQTLLGTLICYPYQNYCPIAISSEINILWTFFSSITLLLHIYQRRRRVIGIKHRSFFLPAVIPNDSVISNQSGKVTQQEATRH